MAPRSKFDSFGKKQCTCCHKVAGREAFYTTGKTVAGEPKYNSWCKECISKKQSSYHTRVWGEDKLSRVAFKRSQSPRAFLSYLRGKAVKRAGSCISLNDLLRIFEQQGGRCALTGRKMTMTLAQGVVATNISIDQIRAGAGYSFNNVQLVCRDVNVAKNALSVSEFVSLCRSVVEMADAKNTSLAA